MQIAVFFALIIATALARPEPVDEALVDVVQDDQGYYKYTFKSKNITREEERQHDGSVKGFFSYLDENKKTRTIHYTAGADGFTAEGDSVPVDLPEVAEARKEHEVISEKIRSLLPTLKSDDTVDEAPEVELSKEEFLQAVSLSLNPQLPLAIAETPEVEEAKKEFFKSFSSALEN